MEFKNYINGKWVAGKSAFQTINPANEELIADIAQAEISDVDAAVHAAKDAFDAWRLTPAPLRGEILFRIGDLLKQKKEELSQLLTREMGKVIAEARGDVQEAIDMAFYMGGEGRRLLGYTAPVEMMNKFGMAVRDPSGVVGLITPWNFPIAVPSWKIFPALVAGNTVIWKPSPEIPAISAAFVKIFEEAGVPAGVFNLLLAPGADVAKALVSHPDVRVLSFTGSTTTGRSIAEAAGKFNKKLSLEMGGKNAIIVMDDANLELVVDASLWAAFGTTGQRCTAASRLIVQKGIASKLKEALTERAKKLTLGDGLDPAVDVGPVINKAALARIDSMVQAGAKEARVLTGASIANVDGKGFFYAPTLFDNVQPGSMLEAEEIFGPVLSIIEVGSLKEAIEVNNRSKYGLSTSIFTQDVNQAFTAMRDIFTGLVYINHGTTGAEIQFPFGGVRGTGNGHREAGQAALEVFTEWKSIYVDYSGKLQRAQIDNREE
ncbi:MAG: aldehyde dehydrogenase family protein [Anaerolineaceae bacterium]|jgi:aldehyde dehydrogenase (NAD+)|nr:aldehyde dehydrogenase family protein [Anaerolineaceae bacterium]OQY87894.1 MAG: aldehyde dehydrogenase [Anaerolineae bacterium UTCFX1]